MSKIRSAPKYGKKPSKKRLCQSILSRDLKSIYLARGKRFRKALSQTRIASRLSLAHSVTPRLKTVHWTVFPGETAFLQSAHSSPPFSNSIKKRRSHKRDLLFWRRRGDSLRYPSPKNSPPDCFSRRNCVSPVGSFESPLLQFDKKRRFHKWNLLFLAEKGGLEPPRQFLDRPTPLAGAPRHQLEYFSRLVSGLRFYLLLETAVLNSFLFLCR